MCLWVAGHSSVETIRDQLQRAIAAAGTPSEILAGEEVRSIGDRSTQLASQERCRAGPSCDRRVGFRPESLGRVSAATLQMSGRYSGCRWDQVLVPHVRRLPHSRSAPFPAPQRARSALPNPGQALPACRRACSVAPRTPTVTSSGSFSPGDLKGSSGSRPRSWRGVRLSRDRKEAPHDRFHVRVDGDR
jgi:hypothetical protein